MFYYHCQRLTQSDQYAEAKEKIQEIFYEHKGRYGYRRITSELRKAKIGLNHKTVQKLMKLLGLKSKVRPKCQWQSKIDPLIAFKRQLKIDPPLTINTLYLIASSSL